MGKYKNDRTAFSISLQTQECSCGFCLKTQQLFTPHSPMSCLFSWLTVFSLLQSFLNFAVWFRHQTFNQIRSLPKQVMWLWDFCTQRNCKNYLSNCPENISYEIKNSFPSLQSERWIVSFIFRTPLRKQSRFLRNDFHCSSCFNIGWQTTTMCRQCFSSAFIKLTFRP